MDQNRQIRFLVPPFVLFASLLWGTYFAGSLDITKLIDPEKNIVGLVAAFVAAAGLSAIPLGFLIGAISMTFLRCIFRFINAFKNGFDPSNLCTPSYYEVGYSEDCLDRIWPLLKTDYERTSKLTLYIAATFDHELLPMGIHEWLMRRWSTFNISIHSITALLLSHIVGIILSINQTRSWWAITGLLTIILLVHGVIAWRETMGMAGFQAHRTLETKKAAGA